MSIWEIVPDSNKYDRLDPVVDAGDHIAFINMFVGRPISNSWLPIEVKIDSADFPSDFPSLPGGMPPVFTEKALYVLNPLIQNCIEALPLRNQSMALFAINVLDVIDCLDHEHSQLVRSPSSGKVLMIKRYSFYDRCTDNHEIFKIPEMLMNHIYVGDKFKSVVEDNKLGGLRFVQVA